MINEEGMMHVCKYDIAYTKRLDADLASDV